MALRYALASTFKLSYGQVFAPSLRISIHDQSRNKSGLLDLAKVDVSPKRSPKRAPLEGWGSHSGPFGVQKDPT